MNTYLSLVLIPNLAAIFCFLSVVGVIFSGGGIAILIKVWTDLPRTDSSYYNSEKKEFDKYVYCVKRICIATLISMIFSCVIPSSEQMTKVIAINTLKQIKGIDDLPKNLIDRLNELLKPEKS